jgi:ribonuclease HII
MALTGLVALTGIAAIDESDADYIVGSDECGYGAWAGPLVVCAALVSKNWPGAKEVDDSKVLSPARRLAIATKLVKTVVYAIVSIKSQEIDEFGVYKVLLVAHERAIKEVIAKHEALGAVGKTLIVIDGNLPLSAVGISLPKADSLVPAVSIASILGKVARDAHMEKMGTQYPGYGFARHKGYGTPEHQEALRTLGPCAIHRKSYGPVADQIKHQGEEARHLPIWESLPEEE